MEFPPDHTNGIQPHFSPSPPRRVGLVYDERMCKHSTPRGESHPENPDRIRSIWNKLTSAGIHQRCMVFDAKEVEDKYIAAVHTSNHINLIKTISSTKIAASKRNKVAARFNSIYFNEGSSESAYLAAGSVLEAAEKVAKGELNSAFAIVRPPGHHAEENEPMGFCLYNNVAIATNFLLNQKELGINKILIVDWDVHHGNGTQKMFWKDSQVLFFSVHRHEYGSFYPTGDDGSHIMIGEGPGAGYNINVPWENGQCGDADYIAVWEHILLPVTREFNPDIIIISAGFDAAIGDPLGGCRITPHGYALLLKKLMKFSSGKIIMALEGGYNLNSIANSAAACVEVLLEDKLIAESFEAYPFESTWRVIKAVREELSAFWPVLADKLPEELTSKVAPLVQIYSSQSEDEYDDGPNILSEDLQEDVSTPLSKLHLSKDVDGAETVGAANVDDVAVETDSENEDEDENENKEDEDEEGDDEHGGNVDDDNEDSNDGAGTGGVGNTYITIRLGKPFQKNTLKNFTGWSFDNKTGEVEIHRPPQEVIRMFDECELIRFDHDDLMKLYNNPCPTCEDPDFYNTDMIVDKFNQFVKYVVENNLTRSKAFQYDTT